VSPDLTVIAAVRRQTLGVTHEAVVIINVLLLVTLAVAYIRGT
jgi:hypothetical protein